MCICLMIAACPDFKSDDILKREDGVLESDRTSEADNRDDVLGVDSSDTDSSDTEQEKKADPAKEDTGLFFFKGNEGEKFAVCNAGDAFAYVGAMQDSFPHALELSKKGYNAFALIKR